MKLRCSRLMLGLFVEAIALCLILSFRFFNIATTVTLLIFNLLFTSLIMPLNGTRNQKLGIIASGNIIGLIWNFVLNCFAMAGSAFFGSLFNVLYIVAYPFLNFMWIVSFWSISLAVLPKPKNTQIEVKT